MKESNEDVSRHYVDLVGKNLSVYLKHEKGKFIDGEVIVFIGYHDKKGRLKIKYFPGTEVSSHFKEKLCETALDIVLNDAEIELPKKDKEETTDTQSE
jgi:hypothetical protein